MKPEKPGKFIVIEGPDGVGKTTVANVVVNQLRLAGASVTRTSQPSAGPIGTLIRDILAGRCHIGLPDRAHVMSLLFEADRLDHVRNVVEPMLNRGVTVVCDRYGLSGIVYQLVDRLSAVEDYFAHTWIDGEYYERCARALRVEEERFREWLGVVSSRVRAPDACVVLLAPHAVLEERLRARGAKPEMYESGDFLRRVERLYAEPHRLVPDWRLVVESAEGTLDEVVARVRRAVESVVAEDP